MIRLEAGMATSRFTTLLAIPERGYRRWQHRARGGAPVRGPWPTPRQDEVEEAVVDLADQWPAWGHRQIAALARTDRHPVSESTALRVMRRTGRVLTPNHTRERRDLSAARRAAFVVPPAGRNEVWQLDFTEWETTMGGTWRIAGCTDYWANVEFGWHVSMTQNHSDAIAAVTIAIEGAERLLGCTLADELTDPITGEIRPIAVVTDNGPAFKSHGFERFIASRPELSWRAASTTWERPGPVCRSPRPCSSRSASWVCRSWRSRFFCCGRSSTWPSGGTTRAKRSRDFCIRGGTRDLRISSTTR